MTAEGVFTFETTRAGAVRLGRHRTLGESSASLPEGAYTTFRTYGGRRVLRLDRHLRRLSESIALQGRRGTIDAAAARKAISTVLDDTGFPESRLRLTFAPPWLYVAIERFQPLPRALYEKGVACVTVGLQRENPHAKDTRFLATTQRVYGRLPLNAEEGLLVAPDGTMLEGLTSNFFAVADGRLRTEGERVLPGVTRALVLEVAEGILPVELRAVSRDELAHVQEAFLTSVSREVLPVVRIDTVTIGDGSVGPKTREIMGGFEALVEREAEPL